jgi:peptide-methionine (S)-S-oxide reductase
MTSGRDVLVLGAPLLLATGVVAAVYLSARTTASPQAASVVPAPSVPSGEKKMITAKIAESKSGKTAQAVFGAGCFWGVEAAFRRTPGVLSTEVGYAGGSILSPTYEQVCTDTTGHAEVVRVEYDPAEISFAQLLDVFFENHNPTQLNRQGPDFGKQYRSVVFYADAAEQQAAEAAKEKLAASGKWNKPIVTQVTPLLNYFPAEGYHQQYLEKRGLTHCHM